MLLAFAPSEPASAPTKLTLRNGTVYLLKEPPRISGTRIIFTTLEGKLYMLDQSEIEAVGAMPRPTVAPKRYDIEDSRQLGAIARQRRAATGRRAEVAPRSPVKRPVRTPRPGVRVSPTARASGKTSPG